MLPTTRVITARTKFPANLRQPGGEPGGSAGRLGTRWPGTALARHALARHALAGPRWPGAGQTVGAAFEPVSRLGGTGVSFLSALNSCVAWAWSQSTATPAFGVW